MSEMQTSAEASESAELTHFTVIANGSLSRFADGLVGLAGPVFVARSHTLVQFEGRTGHITSCQPGPAFLGLKVWAVSTGQAMRITQDFGRRHGFECDGKAEVYQTAAQRPNRGRPFAYDLQFTPYDAASGTASESDAAPGTSS